MAQFWKKMKEESAGVMVENVIVLPIVFVVILFMVVSAFMIHDRTTIESAARRGATYAAHCIADPNYASLVGQKGELDIAEKQTFSFNAVGKNVKAYRYITGGPSVKSVVETEVKKIIERTRIPWIPQKNIQVTCQQENKIIYQNVTVTVKVTYSLPDVFRLFGLQTQFDVKTEAKLAAVDPDEFIRNADLVVDLITTIDKATGGYVEKAIDKIRVIGGKLQEWISME